MTGIASYSRLLSRVPAPMQMSGQRGRRHTMATTEYIWDRVCTSRRGRPWQMHWSDREQPDHPLVRLLTGKSAQSIARDDVQYDSVCCSLLGCSITLHIEWEKFYYTFAPPPAPPETMIRRRTRAPNDCTPADRQRILEAPE